MILNYREDIHSMDFSCTMQRLTSPAERDSTNMSQHLWLQLLELRV